MFDRIIECYLKRTNLFSTSTNSTCERIGVENSEIGQKKIMVVCWEKGKLPDIGRFFSSS